MAKLAGILLICCCYSLCSLVHAAPSAPGSFEIPSRREEAGLQTVRALNAVRKRQTGVGENELGKILYWFLNDVEVGDGKAKLLLDTGSTDLILNPGKYKPSADEKPYGTGHFKTGYEGVNRAGFGFEKLNGTTSRDKVTAAGLTVPNQPIGECKVFSFQDIPPLKEPNPGDGIMGFAGAKESGFHPPADSWFWSLCKEKLISECKFGLLFGTSGKGLTIVGKLARKYLKGELTEVPSPGVEYNVKGDVALDGKIIFTDQLINMDVGTDNIQSPIPEARKIFNMLGYKMSEKAANGIKVLKGDFECDKPPTLGFSFPAQSELKPGQKSRIFNVSPKVWDVYRHEDNTTCTSILGGTNAFPNFWLLGQPFFAGHYVNYDITAHTIGYGDLEDPSMESCT